MAPVRVPLTVSRYRNLAFYLLVAAIWGTAFPVVKTGLGYMPPVTLAAVRADAAAVALFAYVLVRGEPLRPTGRADYTYIAVGGIVTMGVHHGLLFAGQQYVTSAVAAVLLGLIPVITPALTRLTASDDPLTPVGVVGVVVGFGGVAVIANPDPATLLADLRGVLLVFGAALTFAIGAVFTHDTEPHLSVSALQPWLMLVGAVCLHAIAAAMPGEGLAHVSVAPPAIASVLYLGLIGGGVAFTLYFVLLRRLGPIQMGFLEYVIPVFAALMGWILLGERVSPDTVGGFGLILVGFLLVKRRALRAELRRATR
jgi:drug/metabolite transporter (DMT)-like permease